MIEVRNLTKSFGDKVLVILKRNYEYWYVAPALHKLGAVIIPATNLLTQSDISYRVNTAGIKAAVCTPDETTAEDTLAVASQPNTLETVFVPRKQIFGAVDFTEEVENAPDTLERVETKAEEPMVIYFTSGTTGYPILRLLNTIISTHSDTLSRQNTGNV